MGPPGAPPRSRARPLSARSPGGRVAQGAGGPAAGVRLAAGCAPLFCRVSEPAGAVGWGFPLYLSAGRGRRAPRGQFLACSAGRGRAGRHRAGGGRGPLRAGVCGAQTRPPIALPGFCELPASALLYKEEAARQKRCSRLQSVWFFRGFGGSPGCSALHASLCMSAVCGCRPPAGFSWSSGTRFG